MNSLEKIHFFHRAWRYRLVSERFGISFLLNSDLSGSTALVIGANRGIFSYWMHKKVGSNGRVIAFEPQPELFQKIQALKKTFSMPRLEIADIGLSTENKTMTMYRPRNHWDGTTIESRSSNNSLEEFTVNVKTLDSYLYEADASKVRFIKCDVEGHELAVLNGRIQTIKREKPHILLECHDAMNPNCKVFKFLKDINYRGFCFFKGGITAIENYRRLNDQGLLHRKALIDFVFAHEDQLEDLPLKPID